MTDAKSIDPWLDEWSRPAGRPAEGGVGGSWMPLLPDTATAGGQPGAFDGSLSKLTVRLAAAHRAQQRMLDDIRTLHRALRPGLPSGVSTCGTTSDRLLVAPLDVPDRVTKRNYNYFNELNEALLALRDSSDGRR